MTFAPVHSAALMLLEDREAAHLKLQVEELRSITEQWTAGPLKSAEASARLSELMVRGAAARKALDTARLAATAPLRKQVDQLNALFGAPIAEFDSLRTRGDALEKAWRAQERARIKREEDESLRLQAESATRQLEAERIAETAPDAGVRAAALESAEEASADQAAALVAAPAPMTRGTRTDSGTSAWREVWLFTIDDPVAVPREYCAPVEKLIRAAVASGVRVMAGVTIYPDEQSTLRPGR